MNKERFRFALQHNAASYLLLLLLFWLIRIFEYIKTGMLHPGDELTISNMLAGLALDAWIVLFISVITLPLYVGAYLVFGSFTRYLLFVLFLLLVIIYLMLVQYYTETSIPLGADFWGYSADDIQTTINASSDVGVITFIPFFTICVILFYLYKRFQEYIFPKTFIIIFYTLNLSALVLFVVASPSPSWFKNDNAYTVSVNKLGFFGGKSADLAIQRFFSEQREILKGYPLVHRADTADVLSPYFDSFPSKPNIVVLMVEGLGGAFVGPHAQYGGCTPFLDSLSHVGLYWENMLSATGRTFGVLPSLFGSLPFGKSGFMETGSAMPDHQTLFSLLKQRGYITRYFYGGNINFDHQDVFLERQGVDFILTENKFPAGYTKTAANSEGFSWGFPDGELFRYALQTFSADTTKPVLSVFMTLSTHEPFIVPDQEKYLSRLEQLITSRPNNAVYREYKATFSSLLYMDNAIRDFFNTYRKRADYSNTIFLITGDHRMIPVPQSNRIDRYHVPLIMFSPRLKHSQTFEAVNSHLDLTPTLIPFLSHQGHMQFPQQVHWIGIVMDTSHTFSSRQQSPFMRNKNELKDYIDGNYFYSDGQAYRITPGLNLENANNKIASDISKKLNDYIAINQYVMEQNKIYNNTSPSQKDSIASAFTRVELMTLHFMGADTMSPGQLFKSAQRRIHMSQYGNARLICKKALLESPNYTDIRVLYANSFTWKGDYGKAREEFASAVARESNNREAWQYYIRNEIFAGNYSEALTLADSAWKMFSDKRFEALRKDALALKNKKK